jgi:hypothetical protein
MILTRWLVIVLGVLRGGWMTFDGIRALVIGDYMTPLAGPYAGKLGAWSKVVSYVGIEPRSMIMKLIFVVVGLGTLLTAAALAMDVSWATRGMLVLAVATLWFAPFGTLTAVLQLGLLALMLRRG